MYVHSPDELCLRLAYVFFLFVSCHYALCILANLMMNKMTTNYLRTEALLARWDKTGPLTDKLHV